MLRPKGKCQRAKLTGKGRVNDFGDLSLISRRPPREWRKGMPNAKCGLFRRNTLPENPQPEPQPEPGAGVGAEAETGRKDGIRPLCVCGSPALSG